MPSWWLCYLDNRFPTEIEQSNCSYAFPVALLPGRGRTTHGPPGAGAAMPSRWLCSFDSPAAAHGHCRPSGRLRRGSLIGWVSVKAHDDS